METLAKTWFCLQRFVQTFLQTLACSCFWHLLTCMTSYKNGDVHHRLKKHEPSPAQQVLWCGLSFVSLNFVLPFHLPCPTSDSSLPLKQSDPFWDFWQFTKTSLQPADRLIGGKGGGGGLCWEGTLGVRRRRKIRMWLIPQHYPQPQQVITSPSAPFLPRSVHTHS